MEDNGKGHRVVFQFAADDFLSQKALLSNLKNLLTAWPEAEIAVVVHGPGIQMVTRQEALLGTALQEMVIAYNVRIVVCENSMRSRQLTTSDLLPFVQTVPVAMVELILRQEQGWAYIRAGL